MPRKFLLLLVILPLLPGCAPQYFGRGREFKPLDSDVKLVAIIPPEMMSYSVTAGGVTEYRDDWSTESSQKIAKALKAALNTKGFQISILPPMPADDSLRQVAVFMKLHTVVFNRRLYGPRAFRNDVENFDFSVGSVQPLCAKLGVDALLFVYGFEENFSTEHLERLNELARTRTSRSQFFGILSAVLTGYGSYKVYQVPGELAWICGILVKCDGSVAWYHFTRNHDDLDLRDERDVRALVKDVSEDLERMK